MNFYLLLFACAGAALAQALPLLHWLLLLSAGLLVPLCDRRLLGGALLFVLILSGERLRDAPKITPSLRQCQATVAAVAFPRRARLGYRLPLRILAAKDCPQLVGVVAPVFSRQLWPLAQSQRVLLQQKNTLLSIRALRGAAGPAGIVMRWRVALNARLEAHYGPRAAAWFSALLLGNRGGLTPDDARLLRRSGTTHLLAISGLHLALFAGAVFTFLKILWGLLPWHERLAPRSLACALTPLFALGFVFLTGAQTPVWRAWVMLACLCARWFWPRAASSFAALAVAAVLVLVADPSQIASPGAWFSFLATAVVLGVLARGAPRWGTGVRLWLVLQAAVTLSLAPLLWALFGGLSLSGFFANLVVLPWLGLLWILGFLGLVFSSSAAWATTFLQYYLAALHSFAAPSWAWWAPLWQPTRLSAAALTVLVLALLLGKAKPGLWAAVMAVLALQFFDSGPNRVALKPPVVVYFQGRKAWVVNTGNRGYGFDEGQKVLALLRRRGATLEGILITSARSSANRALKTVHEAYPRAPIYTLLPEDDSGFAPRYCPTTARAPLQFGKDDWSCFARLGSWQIRPAAWISPQGR